MTTTMKPSFILTVMTHSVAITLLLLHSTVFYSVGVTAAAAELHALSLPNDVVILPPDQHFGIYPINVTKPSPKREDDFQSYPTYPQLFFYIPNGDIPISKMRTTLMQRRQTIKIYENDEVFGSNSI
uniref:Uncharacterized protein n=1 Tax=Glossina pallidipes TaxID=7398 RepID=A0A1A9ZGA0_GLOPL